MISIFLTWTWLNKILKDKGLILLNHTYNYTIMKRTSNSTSHVYNAKYTVNTYY